jgi:uncharacterized protein YjdB
VPGETGQFVAIGTTEAGTTKNVTNSIQWGTSSPQIATITQTGTVTAVGQGSVTITGVYANADGTSANGTATFTVTNAVGASPEPLQSVAILPAAQNIQAGQQSQLIAIGTYASAPFTRNITKTVTWASSNNSIASITAGGGLVTAVGAGAAAITAIGTNPDGTLVTASATVTVSASGSGEPIVSLAILPAAQTSLTTGKNANVNFIAIATTSSGATVNLTSQSYTPAGTATPIAPATWTSSNPLVATVCTTGSASPCTSSTNGVATPLSAGVTAITAIVTNPDGTVVTGSAAYTVSVPSVTEPYVSLAIVPASQSLTATGQKASFIAIGTTSTGATVDLTNATGVVWSSSSNAVASNVSNGVFQAVGNGAAAITVEVPNPGVNGNAPDGTVVTASASLTVAIAATPEPLLSMSIVPGSQTVAWTGQVTQFLALGDFTATSSTPGQQNMAGVKSYTVVWYSSNPQVATICTPAGPGTTANCASTPGLVTAVGPGTTAITAIATNTTDGSAVTAAGSFTVTGSSANTVTSLLVIPGSQAVTLPLTSSGTPTTFFAAIGTNALGLQENLTNSVVWSSSNTAVATINASTGAVTAVGQGTTNITATFTNVPSSGPNPALVVTASAALSVSGVASEPLLSLTIYPGSQTVTYPGQTSQLVAIGTFSTAPVSENLTSVTGPYQLTWISSNPSVATVCSPANASLSVPANCASTPGLVTGVSQGTAAITAIASNTDGSVVTGLSTFTVSTGSTEQMSSLTIVPNTLSLSATGQPGYFLAIGTSGTTGLQEDVTNSSQLAWSSSNPTIATVCSQVNNVLPATCTTAGAVTGVSAGTSTITAEFTNTAATSTSPAVVVTGTGTVSVTNTPAAEPLLSIVVTPSSALTDNLEGSAQFLAFGTFSTAPTVLDVTNGFVHAGFPNAGCTDADATFDANAIAADVAAGITVPNPLPNPACTFVPVNWVSLPFPFNFPISSAGGAGANGGLITAEGAGLEDVYAVAANPDGTLVYGSPGGGSGFATFNCPYTPPTYATITTTIGTVTTTTIDPNDILNIGTCNSLTIDNSLLTTLTVFNATLTSTGLNQANWLITAPDTTGTENVIHCGGTAEQESAGGSVCEATYPPGTTVTLTAQKEPEVTFDGWSSNCTPTAPINSTGPNSCTIVVGGTCTNNTQTDTTTCTQSNVTVGAIFNYVP